MVERDISNNQIALATSLSNPTISNIKNNEFHNISVNVLTKFLEYFDISFTEFGTVYSKEEFLKESLSKMSFNESNLQQLESLILENIEMRCYYNPYSSNETINIHSKRDIKKYSFSGNIRLNIKSSEFTFEVIDFDFYRLNKNYSFDKFYALYKEFIIQLEEYATKLGFNQIIMNSHFYIDPRLNMFTEPRFVNQKDLQFLVDNSKFSSRENELMKFSILQQHGYTEQIVPEEGIKMKIEKDKINRYIDRLQDKDFFEKENIRHELLTKEKLSVNIYTKPYVKILNEY